MKALTAAQVEDAQIEIRGIQSSLDRLAIDIGVLRIEFPTQSDKQYAENLKSAVATIRERLDKIEALVK